MNEYVQHEQHAWLERHENILLDPKHKKTTGKTMKFQAALTFTTILCMKCIESFTADLTSGQSILMQ